MANWSLLLAWEPDSEPMTPILMGLPVGAGADEVEAAAEVGAVLEEAEVLELLPQAAASVATLTTTAAVRRIGFDVE